MWGLVLAFAAIVAVAASPAIVGIYLGSALTAAVLVALWISVVMFVTHLRGGESLTIEALLLLVAAYALRSSVNSS
jgi:hypothetical protein